MNFFGTSEEQGNLEEGKNWKKFTKILHKKAPEKFERFFWHEKNTRGRDPFPQDCSPFADLLFTSHQNTLYLSSFMCILENLLFKDKCLNVKIKQNEMYNSCCSGDVTVLLRQIMAEARRLTQVSGSSSKNIFWCTYIPSWVFLGAFWINGFPNLVCTYIPSTTFWGVFRSCYMNHWFC